MSALFPATLQISLFSSEKDNLPKAVDMKWVDLCEKPVFSQRKEGVAAWSPAVFKHERSKAGVLSVNALVFDLDSELTETLIQRLSPYNYVVHSTFTPGRWRIILQTSRPHSPHEHATLWGAMAESLGGDFDEACKDSSRLYYWGTVAPGRTYEKYENFEGQPVDVDVVLSRVSSFYARPTAPPPMSAPEAVPVSSSLDLGEYRAQVRESKINPSRKPLTLALLTLKWGPTKGERDNTLLAAIGGLFTVATPVPGEELCEFLAEHVLSNMDVEPEGREAWHKVFMSMCARNRKWRLENDAKKLSADAAFDALTEKQGQERGEAPDWRKGFQGKKDDETGIVKPRPSGPNVELILRNDMRLRSTRFNVVTREVEALDGPLKNKSMNNVDTVFSNWLSTEYQITVPRHESMAQLNNILSERHFDPLKDYLNSLKWDGVSRVSSVLMEHCGAIGGDFYVNEISKRWFIAAARRGLEPGIQMDNVLILKGKGGVGKTSFVRVLGGEFAAQTTLDLSNKDALQIVSGRWMVELAELSSWRKSEHTHFRGFVTQTEDTFRPPYGRVPERHPRRCVFVGTSNEQEPVDDVDGARRYWTVEVGDVDLEWLKANRDQLWAEAVHLAKTDTLHYFTQEEQAIIKPEVALHQKSEPLADRIEEWFLKTKRDRRPSTVTMSSMLESLGFSVNDLTNKGIQGQAGQALRSLGFMHKRQATGRRAWYYETPENLLTGAVTKTGTMVSVAAKDGASREERENG